MAKVALILSAFSVLFTAVALYFGKRGADAATTATNIEKERRHAEMRPRFRVTCEAPSPGIEQRRLRVKLAGPGELETLDELTVTIRDGSHFRLKPAPPPGQSSDSVRDQVWGPLHFVPGTGPGVTTRAGAVGADQAGRTTTSTGMPVGEEHVFAVEETPPPPGGSWNRDQWHAEVGATLRLRIESHKRDWDPWIAVGELDIGGNDASTDIT
jgi:hypothetical protein